METPLSYNYFLRFSTQIFPDFWPQATLTPARAASQFSSISSLSRLFAIPKSIILRKQCKNSENDAKTSLNYNYFLRFSTKIFSDFWPQATPSIGRRPSPSHRPQAASQIGRRPNTQPTGRRPPTPSPCEKKFVLNKIICTFAAQDSPSVSCKEQGDAAGSFYDFRGKHK